MSANRKVFNVLDSLQARLFDEEQRIDEAPRRRAAVRFVDPDPHAIRIGGLHLREYLQAAGQDSVLAVRTLLREQDWECLESSYKPSGRPPYAPAAMLGLVLYGIMHGVSSLRALERLARVDVGCMWICGGIAPDHSVIGRFLNLHREVLTEGFFEQLTRSVLDNVGSLSTEVSGDGTVVQAAASRYRLVSLEAAQQAATDTQQAATGAAPDAAVSAADTKTRQQAEHKAKVARIAEERAKARRRKGNDPMKTRVSPTEPEAALQPLKTKVKAPSYKPSVLANSDRIIVAKEVDPTNEASLVAPMLTQAERVCHQPPERLLLDAGYHCDAIVMLAVEQELDLLCPSGRPNSGANWDKRSGKKFPKSQFQYNALEGTYRCPAGKTLLPVEHSKGNASRKPFIRYGTPECTDCPLRARCTSSTKPYSRAATGRVIKRYPADDAKDALRQVMRHPQAQQLYRRRQATVEPVFSDLKDRQGLRRFRRRGLPGVRLEFSLHAMAHNLRRFVRLTVQKAVMCVLTLLSLVLRLWHRYATHRSVLLVER